MDIVYPWQIPQTTPYTPVPLPASPNPWDVTPLPIPFRPILPCHMGAGRAQGQQADGWPVVELGGVDRAQGQQADGAHVDGLSVAELGV
jgi:hypothetical protein